MKKLGHKQRDALEKLVGHGGWNAFFGVWVQDTPSQTAKVLESLVGRGLARRCGDLRLSRYHGYKATEEGERVVREWVLARHR